MTADADRFMVGLADGRSIEVLTAGPPGGLPLVFHSGTPAGLVALPSLAEAATARGLRVVFYTRPGYGNSTAQPGRLVAGAASDVAAVLDQLGEREFITAGWSGGGPHALATAALLAERCLAAATIASLAPYRASGLDWLAGMAQENIEEMGAALQGEEPLTAYLTAAAAELADVTATEVAASLGGLVTAADRAAITGVFAQYLVEATVAALASGIGGWRDDDLAFASDWGFSLDLVRVPLSIWQGDQDAMVPFGHGEWLTKAIPAARAHLLPGEGHLTLVQNRIGDILDELTALAGAR
jgi:pimeloyl-ACP methyl ester carboxylesterase